MAIKIKKLGIELMLMMGLQTYCSAQQLHLPGLAHPIPDPFVLSDGTKISSKEEWYNKKRPELLRQFKKQMYGCFPPQGVHLHYQVFDRDTEALNGIATRKQIAIFVDHKGKEIRMDLLVYLPNHLKPPVPVFLGLNFEGNQTVREDTAIRITTGWEYGGYQGVVQHRATEASRGVASKRWPVSLILERGYGVATVYAGDIAPDKVDGYKEGVQSLFPKLQERKDNFSTIGAWAWGLSRIMDYFEKEDDIDARRVAVFGWSRMGKAALWAAANDTRFAMAISNESGAGGAKLFHHFSGEDIKRLCTKFPHWFCRNFGKYIGKDTLLPFDQHELMALIAPRPLYIASAAQDHNSDPYGEFLTALAVDTVYRFLGVGGLPVKKMPPVDHPVFGKISYHVRTGKHNITRYDWRQYLHFADLYLH